MKKTITFLKTMLLAIILLVSGIDAWGATPFTATYTFGSNGDVASFSYNGTAYDGITMSAIAKVGVTSSSSTSNFRATGWPTAASVDGAKYIGFTITAVSGYMFTVNSITFGVGRSGTGTRNTVWRGSSDSYAALINNYTTLNASITNNSGVLNNPDATTSYTGNILTLSSGYSDVTTTCGFRMYMYSAEAGTGTAGLAGPITISGTFEALGGVSAPTTQASAINFTSISQNGMTANWTNGDGAKRVVIMNTSNSFTAPADATDPTANTVYGGSGQQVVYNGTGTSVPVTGLTASTTYYFRVYEYNGSGATIKYLTTTSTNNPNSQITTAASCTTPTYSFSSSSVSKLTTDAAFTNTFTSNNTSTKVWSSSNEAVATVDANGLVTIHSAGTASIKVNQAADATYCAVVDATYTLTVTKPEPTNHATSFTATTNSASQITVNWTDATGGQLPDGYLVIASTGTPTAPIDGTAQADAALVKNIAQGGAHSAVFTGLSASTTYNFSIWPYTNSGAAIDYKTDGVVPTANATTETPLGVTVAAAASDVTANSFTANWGATAGATGYDVNVYTKSGSSTTTVLSENFNLFVAGSLATPDGTDINATLDTYTQTTGWTGSKIYQAAGTIKMGTSSVLGSIITPSLDLTGSNVTLEFKALGWSGDATTMNVLLDGVSIATPTIVADQATWTTISLPITGGTATSKITFQGKQASKGRFYLEDVTITKGGITSSSISGSPFNVATTSKAVSGLNQGTNYYYTVVAKKGAESAVASNEISVTTLIPTFSGTGDWSETARWNTALVPVTTDNVIVDGTATISSNVEVAGLTINASKSLTVNAGKQLTVSGALANNGTLNLNSSASGTATLTAGSVSGSGTANASQYLADARNWYVSSPVVGATIPASGYTFYERDEVNVGWPTPTGTFTQGRGYIALPTLAGSTLTFSGQLNLSNLDVNLTWSGASSKGFNLIGNPYPSHLTWTAAFVDANTALIEPSIYYRTNSGTANNNHQWSNPTFNAHSGASIGGATRVIPPMQAVWIRAVAGGNLTLDNTKLERSHQVSNPLKARAENVSSQNLRLVVSDGQSSDEILVYFNANASNSFDAFDSPKMMNGSSSTVPDMYTMVGSEQLVINGMSSIPSEIPLYFKANASTAGQFSLSATEMSNFETGTLVYIKNNKNGEQQLISDGSVYSFDKASNPTFSIIIKAPGAVTGLGSNNSATLNVYTNAKGQITVAMPSVKASDVVSVYNSVGQQLMSQSFTSTRMMLNKTFTAGVYVVKVNDVIRKVVVE